MELVIRIVDGQPFGNPIYVEHMKAAFPGFTTNPLPEGYAEFVRVVHDAPIEDFMVCEHFYAWEGSYVTDGFSARPMTDEEREAEIQKRKSMKPPGHVEWSDTLNNWVPMKPPAAPTEGGPYWFNPVSWEWEVRLNPPKKGFVVPEGGITWKPPVPRPVGGRHYWDEATESWVEPNV